VSVVVLAITIVAATQLVVATRLSGRAAVQDAVREVAGDAAAIEQRAAAAATPAAAGTLAHDALVTVSAMPGVRSATLSPAGDPADLARLDDFSRGVLATGLAAADERPTTDGSVRVAVPVTIAGAEQVLDVRVDPAPAARDALASWLAVAGLVALVAAALTGLVLLVVRRRLGVRHRVAVLAAFTDDLTGLPNRRAFLRRLVVAVRQARAGEAPLTLVLLDATGLEGVNATAGRRHGDVLLGEVAQVLAGAGRVGSEAFRLGSASFALLLPATDGDQALAVTRELRERIETTAGPLGGVVGLCVLGAGAPDADTLLSGAETALRDARAVAAPAPPAAPDAVQVPQPRLTRPPVARVAAAYAADGAVADGGGTDPGLGLRSGADPWDIRWITGWD
jgi:diguanylate cyclase (GGDEF)-like protein